MKAFLSLDAFVALAVFALSLAFFLSPPAPSLQELYAFQLAGDAAEVTLRAPELRQALERFVLGAEGTAGEAVAGNNGVGGVAGVSGVGGAVEVGGEGEMGERAGVLVRAYAELAARAGAYCVSVEARGRVASTCAAPGARSASVHRWLDDGEEFVRVRFTVSYA